MKGPSCGPTEQTCAPTCSSGVGCPRHRDGRVPQGHCGTAPLREFVVERPGAAYQGSTSCSVMRIVGSVAILPALLGCDGEHPRPAIQAPADSPLVTVAPDGVTRTAHTQ